VLLIKPVGMCIVHFGFRLVHIVNRSSRRSAPVVRRPGLTSKVSTSTFLFFPVVRGSHFSQRTAYTSSVHSTASFTICLQNTC